MPGKGLRRFTRIPLWAGVAAVGCALVLGAGAATAAGGGNHQIFTDPSGDNQSSSSTVYASDIRQVEITSQNSGVVKIATTLVDGDAKLVTGDRLDIYIDYDRNRNTGQSGFDLDLVANGHSGSDTTFVLCRLGTLTSCEEGPSGWAHDQKTADKTHVVDFTVTMGVSAFDFGALETYTSGSTSLTDTAPNSGLWTFETKSDPDNDGLYGTADKCPNTAARGIYDKNHNGCPGPFASIGTKEAHFGGVAFPGFLRLSQLLVTGVPPGSKVVFSSPRGGDRATANSSGTARSRRVHGDLRYGSVITIKITKPAFVGVYLKEIVSKSGLKVARRACIPATGGGPVPCSSALKGS